MRGRIIAGLLILAGLYAGGRELQKRHERRNRAAFILWEARPGMAFAAYDDHTFRVSRRRFSCSPFIGSDRLCELQTAGLDGKMRLLVDSAGIMVLAHFAPAAESSPLRDEARRLAAEWSTVQPGMPRRLQTDEASGTRWVSSDGRWAAEMVYGSRWRTIPVGMAVADVAAIERIRSASPEALFKLTAARLLEAPTGEMLADAAEIASASAARTTPAASAASAVSRAMAMTIAAYPVCVEEIGTPMVAGTRYAKSIGPSLAAEIVEAVRLSHNGGWVVLGDEYAYLADDAGRGEQVQFRSFVVDHDHDVVAFGLVFPQRMERAKRAAQSGVRHCRSPAAIVIGRREDDKIVEAHRLQFDEEATTASIASLTWAPSASGALPRLLVEYRAGYHADTWVGEIVWMAIVAIDPIRVEMRTPMGMSKIDRAGAFDMATSLTVEDGPDGALKLMGASADSLPFFLALPPGPAGRPSGWMLLDLYSPPAPKLR